MLIQQQHIVLLFLAFSCRYFPEGFSLKISKLSFIYKINRFELHDRIFTPSLQTLNRSSSLLLVRLAPQSMLGKRSIRSLLQFGIFKTIRRMLMWSDHSIQSTNICQTLLEFAKISKKKKKSCCQLEPHISLPN